jgi:hypothetical protein
MRLHRVSRLAVLTLALVALPSFVGCGDDDEPTNGDTNPLIGSWNALSFAIAEFDLIDGGYTLIFTYGASGTYSITVTGDEDRFFCETSSSCTMTGTYSSTSSTIVFDAGSSDELVASYSITGDSMSLTATDEGATLTATFERV